MRYLIVSDIHANLAAFEAVLADAEGEFDQVWCLGDVVGYGPDPNECVERLMSLPHVCVAGNHDWAVLGHLDEADFNANAQRVCLWTREVLSPSHFKYLESLPVEYVAEGFTLVHGSPREPVWEYILYPTIALENFAYFNTQVCFVGHTHAPLTFRYVMVDETHSACDTLPFSTNGPIPLGTDRLIINPGSVGQPRDGDARASYAILDTEAGTLEHHRVAYPVKVTQERMMKLDMPPRLIFRLGFGW